MRRLIFALALLIAGPAWADGLVQPPSPTGQAARSAASIPALISAEDPQYGAAGDGQTGVFTISTTTSSGAITFGAGSTVTGNISISEGANTLTLPSAVCVAAMAGMPITITPTAAGTGAGFSGGAMISHVLGCPGSQPSATVYLEDRAGRTMSSVAATVVIGPNFSSSDVGKSFCMATAGNNVQSAPWCNTISAVSSATQITATGNLPGAGFTTRYPVTFSWGTDDRAAITTAMQDALNYANAQGAQPRVWVTKSHFISPDSTNYFAALLSQVDVVGTGSFVQAYNQGTVTGESAPGFDYRVSPWPPNVAAEPPMSFNLNSPGLQIGQCGSTCNVVMVGDSLWSADPPANGVLGNYAGQAEAALHHWNPGVSFSPVNPYCAIGGATWANLDGNPNQTTGGPCVPSTGSTWLSQIASYTTPDAMFIGMQNNSPMQNVFQNFIDVLGYQIPTVFAAHVPTVVLATAPTYSAADFGNAGGAGVPAFVLNNEVASVIRGYAALHGTPLIDLNRWAGVVRDGFDPSDGVWMRSGAAPYYPNNFRPGNYFGPWEDNTAGFVLPLFSTDAPNVFYNTDEGGYIGIYIGDQSQSATNAIYLSYNNSTHHVLVRCDIGTGTENLLYAAYPGLCINGTNGTPPVVPSQLTTIAVTATNVTTTITAGANIFTSAAYNGVTVTIPGAGLHYASYGPFGTFTDPLICTATYVSATVITCPTPGGTTANVTTYTARSGVVEIGTPWIDSGLSDTNTYTNIGFQVVGSKLTIWEGADPSEIVYSGPVMRYGNTHILVTCGTFPCGTMYVNTAGGSQPGANLGITGFMLGQPRLYSRQITDWQGNGGSNNVPISATSYASPFGGDGTNHPGTPMQRMMERVFDAIGPGWFKGTGNGVQTVSSGATATVASCLTGTVNVNDTTAVTITLPAYCATPIVIQDIGDNAGAHNITIAAPSGLTLAGATTITSNYGYRTVRWNSPTTAVVQ